MSPVDRLRRRSTRMLVSGVVLGLLGGFFVLTGLGMMAMPNEPGDIGSGGICAATSLFVLLGPSGLLLLVGWMQRTRAVRLETLASLGATHGRLPFGEIARQTGAPRDRVQRLLLDAVNLGLIEGRLDAEQQVFLSASVTNGIREIVADCSQCGAKGVRAHVPPGGTGSCSYCGGRLTAEEEGFASGADGGKTSTGSRSRQPGSRSGPSSF